MEASSSTTALLLLLRKSPRVILNEGGRRKREFLLPLKISDIWEREGWEDEGGKKLKMRKKKPRRIDTYLLGNTVLLVRILLERMKKLVLVYLLKKGLISDFFFLSFPFLGGRGLGRRDRLTELGLLDIVPSVSSPPFPRVSFFSKYLVSQSINIQGSLGGQKEREEELSPPPSPQK